MPAMAPDCSNIGIRYDLYICVDCGNAAFSDAEGKNEITDLDSVIIPPLGHKFVGGVCERCAVLERGVGVDGMSPNPTPWELANRQLSALYSADNRKATPSDYELVSKIVIEGEEFAVTWAIANESITLRYDEANGVYVVDIPDEINKNCYYSIEASITNNANGRTVKYLFIRLLEATTDGDDDGDSTVCQHKDAEYVKATPDVSCDHVKTLVDVYVCCDCLKIFYDAECEDEVPTTTAVAASPSGHREVGGVCEKCGYYHGEGALPSHHENPTPLEAAWWYIIDLYYADHKKATTTDFELISEVGIDGEEFIITYYIANESITITYEAYDAYKGVYVVDIPDEVSEKCYYSFIATISDGEGNTRSFKFVRVLVPSESN